jgi:hypothetical protein
MDEDDEHLAAAIEAAWERTAIPHPRELLRREHDERLKGRPRDVALENWGPDIEEEMMRELWRQCDDLKGRSAEILNFTPAHKRKEEP